MARKSRKNTGNITAVSASETASATALPYASTAVAGTVYKAAAYLRLSVDDRKKKGDSLETQRNIIENYIAAASGINLYGVYTDNNATGTNFARPGFQKMLMDAETGKINCIIVKDLTRFSRNAIDAGYYLEKHLPALGVRFIAVTDGFDSNESDGGILLPLKNIINESYALDIGRKCRAVQRQNIRDGLFVGRMAPFGYRKAPDNCRKLLIDEEAAGIVKMIFAWAAEGIGIGEILRRLNESEIPTPSRYKQKKGIIANEKLIGGVFWQRRGLKTILTDRVYVGDMVQGKSRKVNDKCFYVSPEEWVCVKDTHEPLVSLEQFDAVQLNLRRTSELDKQTRRESSPYSPNIFKGKVFCARCGHIMHRNRQNKDGVYWFRCQTQWKYAKDACVQVSVKETELQREILAVLHKQTEVITGKLIDLESEGRKKEREKADAELREINQKLNKDGRMLKSLYESLVDGLISSEEFGQMKADYETEIALLSNRADEIRNARYEAEKQETEYRGISEAITEALENISLSAEIIDKLVDKILVSPDKGFEIHLKYADAFREVSA